MKKINVGGMLFLLGLTSHGFAIDVIYQDDFSGLLDSEWLRFDTTTAQPYGPGIYQTTEFGVHLASSGIAQRPLPHDSRLILALHDESVQFSDGILSGKVRRDTDVSRAGIIFRANPQDFSSYVVDFAPTGLELGSNLCLERTAQCRGGIGAWCRRTVAF